jgi:hypothetical protein
MPVAPAPQSSLRLFCRSFRVSWVACWSASRAFAGQSAQPTQFRAELFDYQTDHPDGLVIGVSNFLSNGAESGGFVVQFSFEKISAAKKLHAECARMRLPGESEPGKKWRALTMRGPFAGFESAGKSRAPSGADSENTAIRTCSVAFLSSGANEAQAREFAQRVINLRTGYSGPGAHFAALKLEIGLIAVHGTFNEQTKKNEIGRGEGGGLSSGHL